MKNIIASLIAIATVSCAAGHSISNDIKTGATIGSAACTWIEEVTQNGAVLAICATLEEISKHGRHPAAILRARGEVVPQDFEGK